MKRILLIFTALLQVMLLGAQDRSSSAFGLDPSDEKAVKEIRQRMDSIHAHRPTVALVLSGGGAKGAATVGALRYMEQYDFPVDMVVGTSIGGLLGGLYALGYDVDYLENMVKNMDWDMALSDKVDRNYVPYSKIRYKERFVLSFPFYYTKQDFLDMFNSEVSYATGGDGRLHLSADNADASDMVKKNLLSSLPSGMVYGQNVNQIFSSRTVGYSGRRNFFDFPIPFACVSTDLVSSKAKVWHEGDINLAMRSTMSIPGLFAPVRTQGMVLVDGGMRNNFPVDIARDMGADIVIGIDLSTASKDASGINNLADIVWQGIDMFSTDAFQRNIESVDVRIHPDLEGYGMLDFNAAAVDTMMRRGYLAAEQKKEELDAVRRWIGDAKMSYNGPKAVDIGIEPVFIDKIRFVGVGEKEADYLKSKMTVKEGRLVNRAIIQDDIARIFGKGSYDFVNYEFIGEKEPYELKIICKRGPVHRLGVGFRIDSEELVSVLLNVGLNTNAMRGAALDLTGKVGVNPYLDLHFTYDTPKIPTLNARADVRWTDRNNFIYGTNRYNISFFSTTQELFLSNMQWSSFDVRAGIKNDFFNINRVLSNNVVGDYSLEETHMDFPGAFVDGRIETMDNGYFPTQGFSVGVRYDFMSRVFEKNAPTKVFGILEMDGKMPASIGRFTLIPQGSLRFIFGDDIPITYANVLGGDLRGRYVDHQIPFLGIDNAAFRRNYLVMARMDARYRFGNNHYVTATFNYERDFYNFNQFEDGENIYGFGLGYAYNTIVGPLKAILSWSTLTKKVGFYVALGFDF